MEQLKALRTDRDRKNRRANPWTRLGLWGTLGLLLLSAACTQLRRVVHPALEPAERAKAVRAEGIFRVPVSKRPLPDLATQAPLPQVLQYAFNNNGEIEAAYREWRAAIERVTMAGALADPKLDFSFLFDASNLNSFSAALNSFRLMVSQEIPASGKREAKAGQALAEAQAAGEKFRAARYGLQKQVVQAYADLALNRALAAQTSDTLRLLGQSNEVALHRYHEGAETVLADVRKLEVSIKTTQSEQRALLIAQQGLAAALNGVLNRPAQAPIGALDLPRLELPPLGDPELLARAVRNNPGLAAMRKDVEARGAAQVLAELEKKPDYSIGGGLDNPLTPILSAGMTLPINRERIRAGIAEALALRQAAQARLRAAGHDTQARLVMALASLHDAERVLADYRQQIIPKTEELLDTQLSTYGSGGGEVLDILDTERLLIDFRKLALRAESDRVRASAEIEEIAGEDLFRYLPAEPPAKEPKR